MEKVIYVKKTSEGIFTTGSSGTIYEIWYFDNIKKPKAYIESLFDTLKYYQKEGYKISFEEEK